MSKSTDSSDGGAMPAEGHKTRRFFLAAGSTTAVFATLGAAAAMTAPTDPIFAAIARHKDAFDAFNAVCPLTDNVVAKREGREVTAADEAMWEAASEAEELACSRVAETAPQTIAGARAQIEWAMEFSDSITWQSLDAFFASLLQSPILAA